MHVANRILAKLGLKLSRAPLPPRTLRAAYKRQFGELRLDSRGFGLLRLPMFEPGDHPIHHYDFECGFASQAILRTRPTEILDVGSYRLFIIGLTACFRVTTVDIRRRDACSSSETIVTGDASHLPLPDGSFDCVVSLCALEHFGLGRYGDPFDPDADVKAASEMVRVLRPGGSLIVSTAVTRGKPTIAFNAHRIYDMGMITHLFSNLSLVDELFVSRDHGPCSFESLSLRPGDWEVYCGHWQKA